MTERSPTPHAAAPRHQRLSKRTLRAWAWIAGCAALFTPFAALAAQPKVGMTSASAPRPVIIKRVVRRVVVVAAKQPTAPARVVYVSGGTTGGGTAPAPAPVTTTGGSAVPR
jgi:hypothetical protein